MKTISARDAAKSLGALLDAASKAPVTILRHGRPRAVVVDCDTFALYRSAYQSVTEDTVTKVLQHAVNLLADGQLRAGQLALGEARRMTAELHPGPGR